MGRSVKFGKVNSLSCPQVLSKVGEEDNLTVFLEEQFLVPPWEPLNILKEGDLLRVTLSRGKTAC